MFGVYMNYMSVLVAAIAGFVFGWLWHGPLFGKKWRELEGFPPGTMGGIKMKSSTAMLIGFISTFIFAWGLAYLLGAAGVVFDLTGALIIAIVIWIAFVVTTLAGAWLWEGKSGKLFLFSSAYNLCAIVIMTLILALW